MATKEEHLERLLQLEEDAARRHFDLQRENHAQALADLDALRAKPDCSKRSELTLNEQCALLAAMAPFAGGSSDAILAEACSRLRRLAEVETRLRDCEEDCRASRAGVLDAIKERDELRARIEKAGRSISLTDVEIASNFDRVRWAETLIAQLPNEHEGAASWLMNYGTGESGARLRKELRERNPHKHVEFAAEVKA